MIRQHDPSRTQTRIIMEEVSRFSPMIRDRLTAAGLSADIPLVMAEVRTHAWTAAITSTAPNVQRYVRGCIALWIRNHLSREHARSVIQLPLDTATLVTEDPATTTEDRWRLTRLIKYLVDHLGEDSVRKILNGALPAASDWPIRVARVIVLALALADTTRRATPEEIRCCLAESDQEMLDSGSAEIAALRGVGERQARNLRSAAHNLYIVASSVYWKEVRNEG